MYQIDVRHPSLRLFKKPYFVLREIMGGNEEVVREQQAQNILVVNERERN